MEQFWKQAYGERDVTHPVVQIFAQQRVKLLKQYVPLQEIRSALDVGCGSGFSIFLIAQHVPKIFGVDLSPFMLRRNPLPPHRLVQADARALPFSNNAFDLVYCWELLHHMWNPLPVVKEMARVSRKWVVLFEPSRYHPVQFALALSQREHRPILKFSKGYLTSLVEKAELQIVMIKRVGWIFPNKTPWNLALLLQRLPFVTPFGISYFVVANKQNSGEHAK